MRQAWAAVSFSADLISCLLSFHMALLFLDGNPRKEDSRGHRRAQQLSRADHPTDGRYATDKATLGHCDSSTKSEYKPFCHDGSARERRMWTDTSLSLQALVEMNTTQTLFLLQFLFLNCTVKVSAKERAFCIEGFADESAVRQSEGERAALLGQLSLACHFSVHSALLDIYLPCGAAGLVTHSQLKPSLLSSLIFYIPSLHSQIPSC